MHSKELKVGDTVKVKGGNIEVFKVMDVFADYGVALLSHASHLTYTVSIGEIVKVEPPPAQNFETEFTANGFEILKNPKTETITVEVNGLKIDITVEERKSIEKFGNEVSRLVNVVVKAYETNDTLVCRSGVQTIEKR